MSRRLLGGLPHSSALAWQLWKELGPNAEAVLFVPDALLAQSLRDDLRFIDPALRTFFLPALETDLLRNRGPSLPHRVERLEFLAHFSQALPRPEKERRLYLVTAEALCQRLPRATFWQEETLTLTVGEELDRSTLAERLGRLGYLVAELVEAPTEYAVRGSIVDFYSPAHSYPVRVELFEDRVQSLRLFQPDSQRRLENLERAYAVPCREFLFEEGDGLRTRLRALLDEWDWDKADREALFARLEQRSFFSAIDYWGPLLNPPLAAPTLAEALPLSAETPVFIVEAPALLSEARTARRTMEREIFSARTEGEWTPAAENFLYPLEEAEGFLHTQLASPRALWLSRRERTALPYEPDERALVDITTQERLAKELGAARAEAQSDLPLEPLVAQMRAWFSSGLSTLLVASSASQLERLHFLLGPYGVRLEDAANFAEARAQALRGPGFFGAVGTLEAGFVDTASGWAVVLDEEIFGAKRRNSRSSAARRSQASARSAQNAAAAFLATGEMALLDLKPDDLVVHKEHGIGRYLGLRTLSLGGINQELLEIEYKEATKLLLPVTRLDQVQKYSGGEADVALDRLGGHTWDAKKAKARKEMQSLAGELLHLYSLREMARGPEIHPPERKLEEFAATFAYVETPDQAAAIEQSLNDLRGPKPMDRLLCGDVGYGKTEVALRTAHAAAAAGYQVALLVPTTVLAAQHERTFKKRLTPLGISVEGISRFRSGKEVREVAQRLRENRLQVVIGTHRLLGQDLGFAKLGLLIIDEEQRFGVSHKEKIKKLRTNVHVLSMTATPIPRTLNLALSGLKDLSIITTPPQDRLSVRTHIVRKKPSLIQEAIRQELGRGGQVFYVHNRVRSLPREFALLQEIVPEAKMEWVHGQMDEETLEERMMNFYEGRTQLLVTTSIIESGLDVPNANTLIVDRADHFGLAQLYQIRGRVGRSNQRAYAYFLLPERGDITQDAEERLAVLESYQELGSGFHIASHDLELRGSGDVLGRAQSGQVSALGFDTYVQLLAECVAEIKGEPIEHQADPEISLGLDTTIPEGYVPEVGLRLGFYRKLASSQDEEEIEQIEREMDDRFGPPPPSVRNLAAVMRIKCQLRRLGVRSLSVGKGGFAVSFDPSTKVQPAKMVQAVSRYPAHFQLNPDGRLLIKRRPDAGQEAAQVMRGIEAALSEVESWTE